MNMNKAVISGWGQKVAYTNLTEETFSWALNEVLNNEKYSSTVKFISKNFRDQPSHPLDRAKYWVEYVIRQNGAPQMQSAAQYLNVIEYNNIDVIVIIVSVVFSVLFVVFWIFKMLLRLLLNCCKGTSKVKTQ